MLIAALELAAPLPVDDAALPPEFEPPPFEPVDAPFPVLPDPPFPVLDPWEDPPEVDPLALPVLCGFEPPSPLFTVPLRLSGPQATVAASATQAT
jgi:hypothetical protein